MLLKFLSASSSTFVMALALTPELTTAMAILVAAIFVGLVNLYAQKTARMVAMRELASAVAPIQAKMDVIEPQVTAINAHVNSEKTRAQGELATQKMQIDLQREVIDEMKKAAALLAQAQALSSAKPVILKE